MRLRRRGNEAGREGGMRLGGRGNEARREGVWGLCTIGVAGLARCVIILLSGLYHPVA